MKPVSRREVLLTGAAAFVFSSVIFRSAQGWLKEGQQYFGRGLARPVDGKIPPPASADIDPVAHALNRLTFGPTPGEYGRVANTNNTTNTTLTAK